MGQRSDGYEHIVLPDKQPTVIGQAMLVRDLTILRNKNPGYGVAVQLQKAQRDLAAMKQLTVITGEKP